MREQSVDELTLEAETEAHGRRCQREDARDPGRDPIEAERASEVRDRDWLGRDRADGEHLDRTRVRQRAERAAPG